MTNVVKFLGEVLTPVIGRYANGQTSIQLVDEDGMPFMTASVAHDINISDDEVIIKNYSENKIEERLTRIDLFLIFILIKK